MRIDSILLFAVSLAVVVLPCSVQAAGLTQIKYDEAKNYTAVGFWGAQIFSDKKATVLLDVGCGYEGKTPVVPDRCLVVISIITANEKYCQDGSYSIKTDKSEKESPYKNYVCSPDASKENFTAQEFTFWRFEDLQKMAESKAVSFRLGKLRIQFDDRLMTAIRDVVAHFKSP